MGLVIRRPTVDDVAAIHEAVLESLEHLRPWMAWAATEPLTLDERVERIRSGTETWAAFVGDRFVGAVGIHDRIDAGGREIGYWVRVSETGKGYATEAARQAVAVAFATAGVDHVEIHHDRANTASRRVPEKLGFTLVRERPDEITAPGECGISCEWRLDSQP
jgi:ribosomal-protein-serine acetyltransferase